MPVMQTKELKKRFQQVRKLCDAVWKKRHKKVPEFTLAAARHQARRLEPCNIWVHSKNGEAHVGDVAIMPRLVPFLRKHNIKITCISNGSLAPLLWNARDVFTVIPYTIPKKNLMRRLKRVTHHSNWSNLLRRIEKLSPDLLLKEPPYLRADPDLAAQFRRDYASGVEKPLVGVVWRTSLIGRNPARDSLLPEWKDVIKNLPAKFVSLQYGAIEETKKDLFEARQAGGFDLLLDERVDAIADLPAYAAQIAACDFVATVDCSTVFLSGGLGRKTLTLIPTDSSFRWEGTGEECPFFPNNRLFRQTAPGQWGEPLAAIKTYLAAQIAQGWPSRPETPLTPGCGVRYGLAG